MNDEFLIELVRENTVLYDTSHPNYVRTTIKDDVWNKIGSKLGKDGKTVKNQWRKLRERHREALRRQKMKKSEGKPENQRPWSYQHQMKFLLAYMKNRNTPTNMEDQHSERIPANDDGEVQNEKEVPHPAQDHYQLELNCDESGPSHRYNEKTQPNHSENHIPQRCNGNNPTNIRRLIQMSEMRAKNIEEIKNTILQREQSSLTLQNDAMYQFFMSMYNTTKGLPGNYQRQIRNKIFEAVSQAEEENYLQTTLIKPY